MVGWRCRGDWRRSLELIGRTVGLVHSTDFSSTIWNQNTRGSNFYRHIHTWIQRRFVYVPLSHPLHIRTRERLTVVEAAVTQGAYDSAPPYHWRLILSEGQQALNDTPAEHMGLHSSWKRQVNWLWILQLTLGNKPDPPNVNDKYVLSFAINVNGTSWSDLFFL